MSDNNHCCCPRCGWHGNREDTIEEEFIGHEEAYGSRVEKIDYALWCPDCGRAEVEFGQLEDNDDDA